MITRIAPTPSGFLHLGNAVNFQLIDWLARGTGGRITLRIDDMDAPRFRDAYLVDIFDVLAWMGIRWDAGPPDAASFAATYSLRSRTEYYRAALTDAVTRGLCTYACRCSRRLNRGPAAGGCAGGCRDREYPLVPGESALRVHVPADTVVPAGDRDVRLDVEMGDFVVWRRDDSPAYHLASIVEDRDAGVTHIVRGEDLRASTAAQVFLAPYLDAGNVASAGYVHHGLVTGPTGGKLSKSTLGHGPMVRTPGARRRIAQLAEEFGAPVAISPLDPFVPQ